jgi:predicted transcriptional regulator
MATYPGSVVPFTTKVNNTDIVDASHVNDLQLEVIAVQTYVGANPHIASIGTSGGNSGAWQNTATTYATLAARLNNIEAGVIADAHSQYLKRAGGETITSATSSTKGLIVKGAASQSVNLQEWQNSAGTVVASVSAAGAIVDTKLTSDINNLYVLNYVFG